MLNRLLSLLSRILYPSELALEPGRFETFLTGVACLPDVSRR